MVVCSATCSEFLDSRKSLQIRVMYTTRFIVENEKEVVITTKDGRLDLSSKRVEGDEEDGS